MSLRICLNISTPTARSSVKASKCFICFCAKRPFPVRDSSCSLTTVKLSYIVNEKSTPSASKNAPFESAKNYADTRITSRTDFGNESHTKDIWRRQFSNLVRDWRHCRLSTHNVFLLICLSKDNTQCSVVNILLMKRKTRSRKSMLPRSENKKKNVVWLLT